MYSSSKPPAHASTPGSPSKATSGLPQPSPHYRDIHMETAKGLPTLGSYVDVRMGTAKGLTMGADITMDTARGGTTLKQGGPQLWERELLESSEVKRKATVAQLCEILYDLSFPLWPL